MNQRIPAKGYREMIAQAAGTKRKKYGNKKVFIGSHSFDSTKEGKRYSHLFILQQRGEIADLELQPTFPLIINGVPIRDKRGVVRKYKADFRYRVVKTGEIVVEDVKSEITAKDKTYRLKIDIMRAAYPDVTVREV
jgi:hypothetical protein